MPWFCYIIKCKNGSLYTGVTHNLKRRFKDHQRGKGAKYTFKYKPVKILWFEDFPDKASALKREKEIKGWRREKKWELIRKFKKALRRS